MYVFLYASVVLFVRWVCFRKKVLPFGHVFGICLFCCRLLFSPSFNIAKTFFQNQFLHWFFFCFHFLGVFVAVEIFAIGPLQQTSLLCAAGKFHRISSQNIVCMRERERVYEFFEYVFVCIKYFPSEISKSTTFCTGSSGRGIINLLLFLAIFQNTYSFHWPRCSFAILLQLRIFYDSVFRNDVNWVKLTLRMSATDRKLKLFKGNKMMWKFGEQANSLFLLLPPLLVLLPPPPPPLSLSSVCFFLTLLNDCMQYGCSSFIIQKRGWIYALYIHTHSQVTGIISIQYNFCVLCWLLSVVKIQRTRMAKINLWV